MAELARRGREVFTREELRAVGMTDAQIARRVAVGRLFRVFRGVYALTPRPSVKARILAATLSANGVASHFAAVHLYGLSDTLVGPIDVTVTRRIGARDGMRLHFTRDLGDIRHPHGVPATTPARTLLDLAGSSLSDRAYRRLVNQAQVQRLVTEAQLRQAVEQARGRPRARLASLIADGPTPTRSTLEDDFAGFARRHGLPGPVFNARIDGDEVDVHIPDWNLVIELDGDRYHSTRLAREGDAAKQARLEAKGFRVLRIAGGQLADERQTLRRLRASGSSSPLRAAA